MQFKKWRWRKNISTTEWGLIDKALLRRRKDGRESEVYFNNIRIPDARVRKEISRHVSLSSKFMSGEAVKIRALWSFLICIISRIKPAGISGVRHSNSAANALRERTCRNRAFPHSHLHRGPNEEKTKHTEQNRTLKLQGAMHIMYPTSGVWTFVSSANIKKCINHYQTRQMTSSRHMQLRINR